MDDIVFPTYTVIRDDKGSPLIGFGTRPDSSPVIFTGTPFWDTDDKALYFKTADGWSFETVPSGNYFVPIATSADIDFSTSGSQDLEIPYPPEHYGADIIWHGIKVDVQEDCLGADSEVPTAFTVNWDGGLTIGSVVGVTYQPLSGGPSDAGVAEPGPMTTLTFSAINGALEPLPLVSGRIRVTIYSMAGK